MKKSINIIIAFCIFISLALPSEAQLLKKVLDETKGKLGQSLEDIVADKASEIIVEKLNHSLEKHIDTKMEEAFRESEFFNEGENHSSSKNQAAFNNYMSSISANVDLPDNYRFDTTCLIEMKDGGNTNEMKYYFSKTQKIFGFGMKESGKDQMMIYDMDNNVTVIYMKDENGVNKPYPIAMDAHLISSAVDDEMEEENFSVRPTGKTAIVAGKTCQGFIAEGDKSTTEFYTSKDVGISYSETFSAIVDDISNSEYKKILGDINGMMMKSITVEGNKESTWEIKQILNTTNVISNN